MFLSGRPYRLLVLGILFVVISSAASLWLFTTEHRRLHADEVVTQLITHAEMLRTVLERHWPKVEDECVSGMVETLRQQGVHLALLSEDKRLLFDSTEELSAEDLLSWPEVKAAMVEGQGHRVRPWGRRNWRHVLVAIRVGTTTQPKGVIWLARPVMRFIEHPIATARLLAIVAAIASLTIIAIVLAYLRVRSRVFRRVLDRARSLSSGDLGAEIDVGGGDELASLSKSLNDLRRRLVLQVETIDRQRQMFQALIDQSQEGVIVAHSSGRIALINPAALRFLNLTAALPAGNGLINRPVETCIPQKALQKLLLGEEPEDHALRPSSASAAGEHGDPAETRLEIDSKKGKVHLLARASKLVLADSAHGSSDEGTGRVVMLTDITELQHTIQVRTDFVANASHELRTPLATIRAAVETLLAMDLSQEREAAVEFLQKIDRHSARLQQMVSDLLDLSRLESPTERFESERLDLLRFLRDLHSRFEEALEQKGLHWTVDLSPEDPPPIVANPRLLQLALDNLVDNAIKFTESDGRIRIALDLTPDQAVIEVADDGCGVAPDEQQRIFERFYQVQRSRSGPERGTGLGLSIVRHAMDAMDGRVDLVSQPGQGTTITLTIPQRQPSEVLT